jgi:hypothetical protein
VRSLDRTNFRTSVPQELVLPKAIHLLRNDDLGFGREIKHVISLPVFRVVLKGGQVVPDAFLHFHDNEYAEGHEKRHAPLPSFEPYLTENDVVHDGNIQDEHLKDHHEGIRVHGDAVVLEGTDVERRLARKTSTGCDGQRPKVQHVQGLSPNVKHAILAVTEGPLRPEGRSDNSHDQRGGSDGNSKEKETTRQTLVDATRRHVHDAIFGWLDSRNESQRAGTNQVAVQHLD